MFFEILGAIWEVETFTRGRSIRELTRLRRIYGRGRWRKRKGFRNQGFAASLEVRKLYPFIHDLEAENHNLIRVVDESGEDYLYPAKLFRKLVLPSDVQRALRVAS